MIQLRDLDAVLFDMDGTLYREDQILPGVAEILTYLHGRVGTVFVTNNSANTADELAQRLSRRGVAVNPADIYSSCDAMGEWIVTRAATHSAQPLRVFNFAGAALPHLLLPLAPHVELLPDLATGRQLGCDVVALGTHFRENRGGLDFERAIDALNLVLAGAELIIGSRDRSFPIAGGRFDLGSGSWGEFFAYASGAAGDRIHHVGKPDRAFFEPLCRGLSIAPSRCLIIGDYLESDILGGIHAGMKTALVLTGISPRQQAMSGDIKPDLIVENLVDLLELWKKL